jgi:5'-3' exoribonuclease 1
MKNDFSARERKFIGRLAGELHLNVRWDEFAVVGKGDDIRNEEEEGGGEDDEDEEVNVVTWRFPGDDGEEEEDADESGAKNGNAHVNGNDANGNGDVLVDGPIVTVNGNDDEWVDEDDEDDDDDDDEESRAAIDRVLGKYEKAKVYDDDGGFDERHERRVEEKMAEWKAGYYHVSFALCIFVA